MELKFCLLKFCLLACLFFASAESDSDQEDCPPPCANPDYHKGCHGCDGSGCIVSGCTFFRYYATTWKTDPCTVCECLFPDNRESCRNIECPSGPVECYGYPVVKKPGKCCPECGFNVSASECALVALGTHTVEVEGGEGDSSCLQTVVEYGCDKERFFDTSIGYYGDWVFCSAVQGQVTQSVEDLPASGCALQVRNVTYETVVQCRAGHKGNGASDAAPGIDLDESCDFQFPTESPTTEEDILTNSTDQHSNANQHNAASLFILANTITLVTFR